MNFYSYGSSSAGNCYLIEFKEFNIVLDLGLAPFINRRDKNYFKWLKVKYVFISHEHIDHTKHLKTFLKFNHVAKVIINKKCFIELLKKDVFYKYVVNRFIFIQHNKIGRSFKKLFWTYAFKVNHNSVANNGYVIYLENKKIVFFTDCGSLDLKKIRLDLFKNTNLFLVESNHIETMSPETEKEMVQYSWLGHFSRKQSFDFLKHIKQNTIQKNPQIVLIHRSSSNYPNYKFYDRKYAVLRWKISRTPTIGYYEIEDI